MGKWLALAFFSLLGPAGAVPGTAPRTITIRWVFVGTICGGLCDYHEAIIGSDGTVRTRITFLIDKNLVFEDAHRVDAAHFAAFEAMMATVRPRGDAKGPSCAGWGGYRTEIRWDGYGAPTSLTGCWGRDLPSGNHLFCTQVRAYDALGVDAAGLGISESNRSAFNGCEAEGFEALLGPAGAIDPPWAAKVKTIEYHAGCQSGCSEYWFQIDANGRGLFRGYQNTGIRGQAVFAATAGEFARFDAALSAYRPKANSDGAECPLGHLDAYRYVIWWDGPDRERVETTLSDACDGAEPTTLLPGLAKLVGDPQHVRGTPRRS